LPVKVASRQMANTTRALAAAKDLRSPTFQAGGRLLAASRSACFVYLPRRIFLSLKCFRAALDRASTFIVIRILSRFLFQQTWTFTFSRYAFAPWRCANLSAMY